jgi:hypothetical protein
MNTTEITLTWNGSKWDCSATGATAPLPPGTTIQLRIPAADIPEATVALPDKILMQKAGTYLYLPITPGGDDSGAWQLWDMHWQDQKLKLPRQPKKALVPILLHEDLYMVTTPRPEFADCRCTIGSHEFATLNTAGTFALSQWSKREKNTLSTFREINYIRSGRPTSLLDQRTHLLEGTPFRDETGEDEGPELFDTSAL